MVSVEVKKTAKGDEASVVCEAIQYIGSCKMNDEHHFQYFCVTAQTSLSCPMLLHWYCSVSSTSVGLQRTLHKYGGNQLNDWTEGSVHIRVGNKR